MRNRFMFLFWLCLACQTCTAQPVKVGLFRQPTANGEKVVFSFADKIWIVDKDGGRARRLTDTDDMRETDPFFSPDGHWIAFSGRSHRNTDVYVVRAEGGTPRRLTYHPGDDMVAGWTPDSERILFRSPRKSYAEFNRLFLVPLAGGPAEDLPMATGSEGSFSPDGKEIAYVPFDPAFTIWKHYRGGRTSVIRILDLGTGVTTEIPRQGSNDFHPCWVGSKSIYFLSDRNGAIQLFSFDTRTREVKPELSPSEGDVKSFSVSSVGIVYEQFGALSFAPRGTQRLKPIPVEIAEDLPAIRPHSVEMSNYITSAALSPSADYAAFEARGEIITVSTPTGEGRNLTNSSGVAERMPAWSPDGKWLAYFSDSSGEYELEVREVANPAHVYRQRLDTSPSFYYSATWSPDSKRIAYTNQRLQLGYVEVGSAASPVLVDIDLFEGPMNTFSPAWSPDGKWLAYVKQLPSEAHAIFLYSLASHTSKQITDGLSDAKSPTFDPSGQCLYFVASTDFGPKTGWGQLSSYQRSVSYAVYNMVTSTSDVTQCGLISAGTNVEPRMSKPATSPDWLGSERSMAAVAIPPKNYRSLIALKPGVLLAAEVPAAATWLLDDDVFMIDLIKIQELSSRVLVEGIDAFAVSAHGETLLYEKDNDWIVLPVEGDPKLAPHPLSMSAINIEVDPKLEWKQMLREGWRLARDFYYDPGMHGLDWNRVWDKYQAFGDALFSRNDLDCVMAEMLGELGTSHFTISPGDTGETKRVAVGLLGADFGVRHNHYYFEKIYTAGEWEPDLSAPLDALRGSVKTGEYLFAVNSKEVTAADDVYRYFEGLGREAVDLRVCSDETGNHCREVTVKPVRDEQALRYKAWVESNRALVEKVSGGKVAYVHLPDTQAGGYEAFNRYFLSGTDRVAAVIDVRYNGGGLAPDYFMDYLRRPVLSYLSSQNGRDLRVPRGAILGPKVMLENEYTQSGGEALAEYFQDEHIGPVVGKRSWGGLVGHYDNPALIDGGLVLVPRVGFWSSTGKWQVEDRGVQPDVEVSDYASEEEQLRRAVALAMQELEKQPSAPFRPHYPSYGNLIGH